MTPGRSAPLGRNAAIAAGAAAALLFFSLRLVLLIVRRPFFDELFSVWIAHRSWGGILEALRVDSGPPLYYFLLRVLTAGEPTVMTGRLLSLLAGVALVAAILGWKRAGEARWLAAFLLALFPPHVYFSAEARAYALAALLAGMSAILFDRWIERERRGDLAAGLALAVAAGYAHYYGTLFLAIPLVLAAIARSRKAALEAAVGSLAAAAAFAPGLALALGQPEQAIEWMALGARPPAPADPLLALSYAAPYPGVFVAAPPGWLQAAALGLTVLAVLAGWRDARARRWAAITLVPVALVVASGLRGREVYFPMRFESVIAAPFAVWMAFSIDAIRLRGLRAAILGALVSIGLVSSVMVLFHAATRDLDPWRGAALFVRSTVPESVPVVASRYGYLEILGQTGHAWEPHVVAFPGEQADHPGWVREEFSPERIEEEAGRLPERPFVWIGPAGVWEERALAERFAIQRLYLEGSVVVARVSEDRVDVLEDEHRGEPGEEEHDDP